MAVNARTGSVRILIWWSLMLALTIVPTVGASVFLLTGRWMLAAVQAVVAAGLLTAVRSEWRRWREMIPVSGRPAEPH